jgi:hypothetical protein
MKPEKQTKREGKESLAETDGRGLKSEQLLLGCSSYAHTYTHSRIKTPKEKHTHENGKREIKSKGRRNKPVFLKKKRSDDITRCRRATGHKQIRGAIENARWGSECVCCAFVRWTRKKEMGGFERKRPEK